MFSYFKNFTLIAYAKLAIGLFFLIMGIVDSQIPTVTIGALLIILTLSNRGHCSSGYCSTPPRRNK